MMEGQINNGWEDLQVQLNPALIHSLKYNEFRTTMPVQEAAIPLLLKNYDLAVQAQTGSGKTLAFTVPLLQRYMSLSLPLNKNIIKFVVISPTRELLINKLLKALPDKSKSDLYLKYIRCATGGNQLKQDIKQIQDQAIVLVGTIGRIKEMASHFQPNWLKKVDYLYIDEADRVLKQKGINQLIRLFQKIRRTAMFSATLQSLQPKDYQFYGMRNLAKISLKPIQKKTVEQKTEEKATYIIPGSLHNTYMIMEHRRQKIDFLILFLKQYLTGAKTIVFFNTCFSVEFYSRLLAQLFENQDPENQGLIYGIHGKLKNKKRARILNSFTQQKNGCLIATDVVSRGIDFDHIHYIIQVDPPEDPDNYIHRIGRTARINRPGTAILLIQKHEQAFISYLGNKSVGVKCIESPSHFIKQYKKQCKHIQPIRAKMGQLMLTDRDFIEKSKKAFVSYIRSYKQHDLKYIFQFKNVNIGFTAQSFFLLRIPRVKQILGKKIQNFQQSQIDPDTIPWRNHNQQMQFQVKKKKLEHLRQERDKQKVKAEMKQDIKNNKSKRKKIKQKRIKKEFKSLQKQYRAIKKQKKNSNRPHDEQSSNSDNENTEQIQKRLGIRQQ